ncbi:hypothetical protein OSB04_009691 [Centaurea solstitialis]|uniref:Uncharacterized protein n=2 Tax=Centaurea solstitialis TaxID=347529 RepID=A0AA38WC52_9ASTR|nr:hypothetical protein OSB04_009691 [Centaurea solstitialis]
MPIPGPESCLVHILLPNFQVERLTSESLLVVQPIGLVNEITGKLLEAITLLLRLIAEEAMTELDVVTGWDRLVKSELSSHLLREAAGSSSNPSGGELTIEGHGMRLLKVYAWAKVRKHVFHGGSNYLAYVVDSRAETRRRR